MLDRCGTDCWLARLDGMPLLPEIQCTTQADWQCKKFNWQMLLLTFVPACQTARGRFKQQTESPENTLEVFPQMSTAAFMVLVVLGIAYAAFAVPTMIQFHSYCDAGWLRETPAVVYPASELGSSMSRADIESASPQRHTLQAAGCAAARVIGVARCGRAAGWP